MGQCCPCSARRQHANGCTLDSTGANDVDRHAEEVDHVDDGPGGLERPTGAVELELHGSVAEGVEGHELGGDTTSERVVKDSSAQHDPALEEALL